MARFIFSFSTSLILWELVEMGMPAERLTHFIGFCGAVPGKTLTSTHLPCLFPRAELHRGLVTVGERNKLKPVPGISVWQAVQLHNCILALHWPFHGKYIGTLPLCQGGAFSFAAFSFL